MKTKVKCFCMALLLCFAGAVHAQESTEGIQFAENVTFTQALELAKKENKLLFIDCFTTWCGPCKMMARDVFTQKEVGDYVNPRFVSLKVDMEKGEGIELKDRFAVRAFPTFLVIDADGKLIDRFVGGSKADKFISKLQQSLSEKGLASMKSRYESGERNPEFVNEYLKTLSNAYMPDECAKVAGELLEEKEAEMLQDEALFGIFNQHIQSPETPSFQYVLDHKNAFVEKYGEDVNKKLNAVWRSYSTSFIKKEADGKFVLDEAGLKDYIAKMKKYQVEDADMIADQVYIQAASATQEWGRYVQLCSDYLNKYPKQDYYIYNWAHRIEANTTDAGLRATVASWLETRIKELEDQAKEQQTTPNGAINMMGGPSWIKPLQELLTKLK